MTKKTRIFQVDYSIHGESAGYAIIGLDQSVIDAVDDKWRAGFYPLHTPEDIACHICYNMIENRLELSDLDGWADKPNSMARILEWPDFDIDTEAHELR